MTSRLDTFRRRTRWSSLPLLVLATATCASMSVESAQNPEVDVSLLGTFEWMDREQPQVSRRASREGLDQRIKTAVDLELEAKGYTFEPGTPDMVVTYHVSLDGATDIQYVNTLPDDRWGIDRGWAFYTERSIRTLEQGTLILDMYHAESGKLAWRGVAKAEIDRTQSPEKRADLVHTAVRKLMSEFPVHTGS